MWRVSTKRDSHVCCCVGHTFMCSVKKIRQIASTTNYIHCPMMLFFEEGTEKREGGSRKKGPLLKGFLFDFRKLSSFWFINQHPSKTFLLFLKMVVLFSGKKLLALNEGDIKISWYLERRRVFKSQSALSSSPSQINQKTQSVVRRTQQTKKGKASRTSTITFWGGALEEYSIRLHTIILK